MSDSCISPKSEDDLDFIRFFNKISKRCFKTAKEHGFHDTDAGNPTRIALIHSELSECLDGIRNGNPKSEHIPDFRSSEEELADVVIRVMDMSERNGWYLAEAIVAKMEYNVSRPFMHGGKKF